MSVPTIQLQTEPRPNCILCGKSGEPLYRDVPSALFETPGRWSFSKCEQPDCGLVWINPTPRETDLHRAYENYFTHGGPADAQATSWSLRDALYAAYRWANYPGWLVSGITGVKEQRAQMFLQQTTPGHLLDVGCGDGKFLSEMKARGWQVDGIDFDPQAIKTAKAKYGLSLRHGELSKAGLPSDKFDAITMSHVVEHVPDPIALLREIKRVLKPTGRLIMTTPNSASIGHRKFGPDWFGVDAPRHLNLFCSRALVKASRAAGFNEIHTTTTAASADIFFGASFTLRDCRGHRMGHQPTPNFLRTLKAAWWQYREYFALNANPDCGEELVCICLKS